MRILGIETSCDETAAAIVDSGTKILSNIISSSVKLHAKTGGIIPEFAARQQLKAIIPVINQSLTVSPNSIDAIAVTIGPGLIGSLLVGVETAKTLSFLWKKPIVPVNHLIGHIYANWLEKDSLPRLPALALVVSGGHTDLVLMKDHGKIKWLGGTRDDAAGECFDKTARLLGLPYPGGPAIGNLAQKYLTKNHQSLTLLPRPLVNQKNFDFSFSGLKTAVLRLMEKDKNIDKERLAAEIQEAIVDILIKKINLAIKKYQTKSLLLAGGVAANARLRQKLKTEIDLFIPPPKLCTDNATFIASCAYFNYHLLPWQEIKTNPQLTIAD